MWRKKWFFQFFSTVANIRIKYFNILVLKFLDGTAIFIESPWFRIALVFPLVFMAVTRYSSLKPLVHFTNVTELNARGEADLVHLDDPFFTIEAGMYELHSMSMIDLLGDDTNVQ